MTPTRQAGFIITLEFVLIMTILVIGSVVGLIAVRNALYELRAAKAKYEVVVKDSTGAPDGPFRWKPVSYDLCEAPQILCRDEGFDENNNGVAAVAGSTEGLFALVGFRPDRFVSRNQIYFTGANCTGDAYIAPPPIPGSTNFPPTLPVGYFNCGLQVDATTPTALPICYGVGPPVGWGAAGCAAEADLPCSTGGRLYRSDGTTTSVPAITSRWVSLNPDCALELSDADPAGTTAVCDDDFDTSSLDFLPAIEVTDMDGDNILSTYAPLFNVMPQDPTVTYLPTPGGPGTSWTEDTPPIDPDGPFPADATTDPGGAVSNPPGADPGAFPDAGSEDDPPPP